MAIAGGPDFTLGGKVALLTGAGRGLGFEMARAFGLAGATVYINGRDGQAIGGSAENLRAEGIDARPSCFAVENEAAAMDAIDAIAAEHGKIDVLVNNVGARMRAEADAIDRSAFAQLIDINLTSAYALTRNVVRHMGPGGRIIMVTSAMGLGGRKGDPAYITAKGGLIALTRALACEYGDREITCNALAPGSFATETNLTALQQPGALDRVKARVPLGRVGLPAEIAGPALFLASPASSYISGEVLTVDGGWAMMLA